MGTGLTFDEYIELTAMPMAGGIARHRGRLRNAAGPVTSS